MTQTISACLVIHNEEKVLERCLKSLKGVVDEIIVVHDGDCTDKSLQIAKRYHAMIFVQQFNGEGEVHRPFSYTQASGDWIIQIDADEYLSQNLRKQIRKLVQSDTVDAYAFQWLPTDGFSYLKGFNKEAKRTLFRKEKLYFIGITHESPQTYGKLVTRLDLRLEHKPGYKTFIWRQFFKKMALWNDIQAWEIVHIDQAPIFHIQHIQENPLYHYYQRQLSHPYLFALKQYVLFDLIKKSLRTNIFYTIIINWKPTIMFYCSVIYTANRIRYYQKHMDAPKPIHHVNRK